MLARLALLSVLTVGALTLPTSSADAAAAAEAGGVLLDHGTRDGVQYSLTQAADAAGHVELLLANHGTRDVQVDLRLVSRAGGSPGLLLTAWIAAGGTWPEEGERRRAYAAAEPAVEIRAVTPGRITEEHTTVTDGDGRTTTRRSFRFVAQ